MVRATCKASANRARFFHGKFNHVLNAFAIRDDLLGQRRADFAERVAQARPGRRVAGAHAALSAGHEKHSVIGGSVAVDRNAVKSFFDGLAQHLIQFGGSRREVRKDVHQHGRQLRMDHARTLGDSKQCDGATFHCTRTAKQSSGECRS